MPRLLLPVWEDSRRRQFAPHPSVARITGRMDSPGPLRADSRSADSQAPAARGTVDDEPAARRWLVEDGIVGAAGSGLTGCGSCHGCIGHAIQDVCGVQLRLECGALLRAQGRPEPPERAKLTDAYNLPGRYVPHMAGPMATGALGREGCGRPASCYRSRLEPAERQGLRPRAFCRMAAGGFRFPGSI